MIVSLLITLSRRHAARCWNLLLLKQTFLNLWGTFITLFDIFYFIWKKSTGISEAICWSSWSDSFTLARVTWKHRQGSKNHLSYTSKISPKTLWKGRSKNAARVIFQYLNIFSERELIEELIDAGYHSTDWKHHFNLTDTLSSLLQQIEPSGEGVHN